MKKMMLTTLVLSSILTLSSCSNSSNKTNTAESTASHEGHDHAAHDHSNHNHTAEANAQQQKIEELSQKSPALQLPAFKFYKVKSGISFSNEDMPKGKKSAFILFDPSCGHCQTEAGLLAKNYSKIKDVNIYFISMNDPALMANFLETFGKELVGKPNVEVLYDKNQDFIQKIHVPKQFPANYVYTAEGKLQSHWDGDKKIDYILTEYTK